MSAWTVSSGHIDVLVNALGQFQCTPADRSPVETGQRLWSENFESVNHCYLESEAVPEYTPVRAAGELHPVAALKAVACFEYQSCEHPGWAASDAYALMVCLRTAILESLPNLVAPQIRIHGEMHDRYNAHPVYQSAPWGFESVDQAELSAFSEPTP